jgi:hypothetical protein
MSVLTEQERANSSEEGNAQCVHIGTLDERHGSSDGGFFNYKQIEVHKLPPSMEI